MKNCYILGLALAGMSIMPTYGQVAVNKFPATWGQTAPKAFKLSNNQLKAPAAIDDKSKGVTVYGSERMDESKLRSFVKFNSKDASNFKRIQTYPDPDGIGHQDYGIYCGASDGKNYYAIFCQSYTYSVMGKKFVKIDMETGDATVIREYTKEEQNAWYGEGVGGSKRNALYDMAYDPHTKTLYAMGYAWNEDGSVGYTAIYAINPETGEHELVTTLDKIYWEFCFDYDGNVWATRPKPAKDGTTADGTYLAKLDGNFQEVSATEIKDEWGSKIDMVNFGTITMNNTNNQIIWIPATANGATTIYTIDPQTAVMSWHSWLNMGNWFTGLYIPYLTGANRLAAGQVGDLDAKAQDDGTNENTISWINPTKAWNGTELSSMEEVRIYRKKAGVATNDRTTTEELLSSGNSDLIATVKTSELGGKMTYTDKTPLSGINTYYVVPSRVSGELGVPDSIRCYSGIDVPGAVQNAYAEKQGEGMKITWSAPENGKNNGYIKADDITYKLTRLPDNVVVAENLKGTEFVDNTLGEQQKYSYIIQGKNATGEGATVETNKVMAGSALETPINLTFKSDDDQERWTTYVFGNSYSFYYAGGYNEDYDCLIGYSDNAYSDYQSTIVSPPLKLKGGKSYRIVSDVYNNAETPFDLKVTMGKKSDDISGATVIRNDEDIDYPNYTRNKFEDMFTAPEDGTYYYGITFTTHAQPNTFKFFGLTVDYVHENDLKAFSIDNIIEAVADADNKCTVKVRNLGSNTQSNYTVKIYCDDEGEKTLVGETSNVPTLEAGQSADVDVTFRPLKDGKFNFYAVVELEGDEDTSNNTSDETSINVLEKGSTAWTNIVTSGKDEGEDTHGPVTYYGAYDYSEAAYYPSEVKGENGGEIVRIAYPYRGNDNLKDRTDESDVKIYMGYNDIKSYTSTADALSEDKLTLVYEGTMYLEPGDNNMLTFNLDTPFKYDNTRNLVIVVKRSGAVTSAEQFCALFKVFNNNWSAPKRSLSYSENAEYAGENASLYPSAPMVYLAIKSNATGITTTKAVAGAFNYDSNSGVMTFADGVKSVTVNSLDGKLVKAAKVNGKSKLALNLDKGVYVVSMKTADGNNSNIKLNVAK